MALGTAATIADGGLGTTGPLMIEQMSFSGDGAYVTGGTVGFQAYVRAAKKDNREIIAVIAQDCGGYFPVYDKTNDKLKVYQCPGSSAPMAEVANAANLSATNFKVLVVSR